MRSIVLFIFFFASFSFTAYSQVPSPQQARSELKRRGLDESEVRQRMLLKGVDIDNIDTNNPVALLKVEEALQQVILELELEKRDKENVDRKAATEKPAPNKIEEPDISEVNKALQGGSEEIKEAIEEGATIEEAVAEQITETLEETLPDAQTWGQQIFRDKSISIYRQSDDVKPPETYVLGVGDYVTVSIWGLSEENVVFEINNEGYIKPDQIPRIYLKGITLGQSKEILRSRFSNYYSFRPEDFEVTLNFARTITINIVGEVFNYGSYTLPAINTAFNALVASGGPTNIGSVRNIELLRDGKFLKTIDVYKFLLNPATQEALYLEENDFISVPIAERLVTIKGAVNRPERYELIEGENLIDLVKYAGGLKDNALRGNIQIKRIEGNNEIILDASLDELQGRNEDFILKPSDEVTINEIKRGVENVVNVTGAVEFGGKYAYTSGLKVSDLLNRSILKEDARKDIAFLQRTNIDGTIQFIKVDLAGILKNTNSAKNLELKKRDKLIIYSIRNLDDNKKITIRGFVQEPGGFPYSSKDNLLISDLIMLGGGLEKNADSIGYLKRMDLTNKKIKEYIQVNVKRIVENPGSEIDLKLNPNDELAIFSKESFTDAARVYVKGAVRAPTDYEYVKGLRLSDVVYLSKGLKPDAFEFGYIFRTNRNNKKIKEHIKVNLKEAIDNPNSEFNIALEPFDRLTVLSTEKFTDEYKVVIAGSVRDPGKFIYDQGLRVSDLIYFSNGLSRDATSFAYIHRTDPKTKKAAEFIRVDLDKAVSSPDSEYDVLLSPLDSVVVYSKLTYAEQGSVSIVGAVRKPGKYKYDKTLNLRDVLTMAGGLRLEAAKNKIDVFSIKFTENEPTETITTVLEVDSDYNIISSSQPNFELSPYDQIVVRNVPDFEFQKFVKVDGAVYYPGEYAILDENEPLSSLVERAGGLTNVAFADGATLYRSFDGTGHIVIELDKALRSKKSRWNLILRDNDLLLIPNANDIVSILGATNAALLHQDKLLGNFSKINIPYKRGKRAMYYVRNHAGGISKIGEKKLITVEHPNGELKKTRNFGLFRLTPKVRKGSVVTVGYKPPPPPVIESANDDKEKVDWEQVFAKTLTQATSIITLIVLLQRIGG